MSEINRAHRERGIRNLWDHYRKGSPTDVQLWTYTREFDDLTDPQWSAMLREAIRTQKFLPSIAELRKLADVATWRTYRDQAVPKGAIECELCEDTGFCYVDPHGEPVDFHQAVMTKLRHVSFCRCRPTNATWNAKVRAQRGMRLRPHAHERVAAED